MVTNVTETITPIDTNADPQMYMYVCCLCGQQRPVGSLIRDNRPEIKDEDRDRFVCAACWHPHIAIKAWG